METISIALLCSLIGVCCTVITLSRNKNKDLQSSTRESAKMEAKLDYIGQGVNSLQIKFERFESDLTNKVDKMNERLIRAEESTKSAHHRIDTIEGKEE